MTYRLGLSLAFTVGALVALAQTPDVALRIDANLSLTAGDEGQGRIRWYDPLGRYSTAGLGLTLDNGLYVLFTQRLQRIPGGADPDMLDQAYVEEPGVWRIGRQILPIGASWLFREYALAGRVDLPANRSQVPITLAVFDQGAQRQRGVIGRLGRAFGLTIAGGRHLGINPTSLAQLRDLEDAPGRGGGWRWLLVGDGSLQVGELVLVGEFAIARQPERATERSTEFSTLRASLSSFEGQIETTFAWSRDWRAKSDIYRFESEAFLSRSVTLRGFVRFDQGAWRDVTVGVRIRL